MVPDLSMMRFIKTSTLMKESPDESTQTVSEGLFGQAVEVLGTCGSWCRIQTRRDQYEGFVPESTIGSDAAETTHWVRNRATLVFDKPDIKSQVQSRLLFGSEVSVTAANLEDQFAELASGGFVWKQHLESMGIALDDSIVAIAEQHFPGAPYLWGGRSPDGCDCSGLVQIVCFAKGIALPRDSGDQEDVLKQSIAEEHRREGDLVYWKGHVGILKSRDLLLHATAHSLDCCTESLDSVIERAGAPTSIKRLPN